MLNAKSARKAFCIISIFLILPLAGCVSKIISPFDLNTQEAIFSSAKLIDQFYGKILEKREKKRRYSGFYNKYVKIEAELKSLAFRNKIRSFNEDSSRISNEILNLWKKVKDNHKKKNKYSTGSAKLDRKRFARMFYHAARAESSKMEKKK